MKRLWIVALVLLYTFLGGCGSQQEYPVVRISTDFGDIDVELYDDKAPVTAANFLKYVDAGLYEDGQFFRIVTHDNDPNQPVWKINVIQGGMAPENEDKAFPPIEHETNDKSGILHTDGVISMARGGPGTASSSFFICINDQPSLDYGGERNSDKQGFAAFGKVISGMDVVREIYEQPFEAQRFTPVIAIHNVERVQ